MNLRHRQKSSSSGSSLLGLFLVCASLLCSCSSTQPQETPEEGTDVASVAPTAGAPAPAVTADHRLLLLMDYDEAKAISPKNADVGPLFRVAADEIEVLKADAEGKPIKVRAKGHVFVEINLPDRATALCEEALITRQEVTLEGNPTVRQGTQVAMPTSKNTSFRINSDRLTAMGRCKIVPLDEALLPDPMLASIPHEGFPSAEPVLAPKAKPWVSAGHNTLLPAPQQP